MRLALRLLCVLAATGCHDRRVRPMPAALFVESVVEPQSFSKAEVDTIRLVVRATNRSDDSLAVPVRLRGDCPSRFAPMATTAPGATISSAAFYAISFGFVIRLPRDRGPNSFIGFYQCESAFAPKETKEMVFRIAAGELPVGRFPVIGSYVYKEAEPVWIEVRP